MTAITSVRVVEGEARRFGEFDLIAKLGRGGMAEAFLAARRAKPTDLVVVKRLTPDFADDVEHREMLEEEARLMPLLSHPNVVRTVEVGEQEGQKYLAMEFLDGLPLDQCFTVVAALGREAAVHVACELLDGLHYVHELRGPDSASLDIVHRDVSPHNVFVTYEGRVALVDFGIAKSRGRAKHTSTGVVRGKLSYMAPEQALCDEVDRRADVFAVGVVLWELVHERRYWEGLGDVQILKSMTFGDLPAADPSLPAPWRQVLEKALAPKPEARFATARDFRDALMALKHGAFPRMELGAAVAESAAGYRDAVRAVVDTHLSLARGADDLPGLAPQSQRTPDDIELTREPPAPAEEIAAPGPADEPPRSVPRIFTETTGAASLDLVDQPAPRQRRPVWVIGLALAVPAVAVVGFLAWPAPAPAPSIAATTQPALPQDELVVFRLDVRPEGARVFFDESRVAELPFEANVKRDKVAHALRVEADGYVPQSRIVVLDKDVSLTVSLEKEPESLRPAASASVPGPRASARAPVRGATTGSPATNASSVADPRYPWKKRQP